MAVRIYHRIRFIIKQVYPGNLDKNIVNSSEKNHTINCFLITIRKTAKKEMIRTIQNGLLPEPSQSKKQLFQVKNQFGRRSIYLERAC